MSFQLTRTHTTVVLAATTIAASLVVIPSLAEGNHATEDPFCASLTGADARITAEYNPLLAQYADARGDTQPVTRPTLSVRLSSVRTSPTLRPPWRLPSRMPRSPAPLSVMPPPSEMRPLRTLLLTAVSTGLTGPRLITRPRPRSSRPSSFRR